MRVSSILLIVLSPPLGLLALLAPLSIAVPVPGAVQSQSGAALLLPSPIAFSIILYNTLRETHNNVRSDAIVEIRGLIPPVIDGRLPFNLYEAPSPVPGLDCPP
ncbi:hypothetical protein M501DRAFT_1002891 [Patellaria atrata CBS 101060]|uniref:Uncharacterized protein n=1 Tax=Patellaria atrata CBS 101060 TaxID=1346257 RepID=A0A9P4SD49_9PEZI|nr:hypothetical protein M501DRAFT_1002891 [Patellaria atrata CBS 101060]